MKYFVTSLFLLLFFTASQSQIEKNSFFDFEKYKKGISKIPIAPNTSEADVDSLLKNYIKTVSFNFDNKTYSHDDYAILIDTLVNIILSGKIKNNYTAFTDPLKKHLCQYNHVVEKIYTLPDTKEGYNSKVADSIKQIISKIQDPIARLSLSLRFFGMFFKAFNDDTYYKFVYENAISIINATNKKNEKAYCYEAMGDFYSRWHFFQDALNNYYFAASIYSEDNQVFKIAMVWNKIGDLFSRRSLKSYINKATSLYFSSSEQLKQFGYKEYYYLSKIQYGLSLLYEIEFDIRREEQNLSLCREIIMEVAGALKNKSQFESSIFQNINSDFLFLCSEYFTSQSAELSKSFAEASLIMYLKTLFNYNPDYFLASLSNLSWINAKLKNKSEALKYIEYIQQYAKLNGLEYTTSWAYDRKGIVLNRLGLFQDAIISVNTGIAPEKLSKFHWTDSIRLEEGKYYDLRWSYEGLGKKDSANYYNEKLNQVYSYYLEEFTELSEMEIRYESERESKNYSKISTYYEKLKDSLNDRVKNTVAIKNILESKNRELLNRNGLLSDTLNSKKDSLQKREREFQAAQDSIKIARESLRRIDSSYNIVKQQKEKAGKRKQNANRLTIFSFLISAGIIGVAYRRNKYYKGELTKKQKAEVERAKAQEKEVFELKNQAIANTLNPHSLKNITFGLQSEPLHLTKDEMSSQLLKLNTFFQKLYAYTKDDSEYTLNEELGFIKNYSDFQCINKRHLAISLEISENVYRVKDIHLPSLLLFNCVENSYAKAFEEKRDCGNMININAREEDGFVILSVADNGKGLDDDDNIQKGGGLKAIEAKIALFNKNKTLEEHITYQIFSIKEKGVKKGTLVNFKIPLT